MPGGGGCLRLELTDAEGLSQSRISGWFLLGSEYRYGIGHVWDQCWFSLLPCNILVLLRWRQLIFLVLFCLPWVLFIVSYFVWLIQSESHIIVIDLPVRRFRYAIHSIFETQFFGSWHNVSRTCTILSCRMFLLLAVQKGVSGGLWNTEKNKTEIDRIWELKTIGWYENTKLQCFNYNRYNFYRKSNLVLELKELSLNPRLAGRFYCSHKGGEKLAVLPKLFLHSFLNMVQ